MSGASVVLWAAVAVAAVGCCFGQSTQLSDEEKCYGTGSVLYPGTSKCYKLGLQGPCAVNQLLFLEDSEVGEAEPVQLTPVCKPCRCCTQGFTAVYWNATGKCLFRVSDGPKVCPDEGTELRADYFGDGECGCLQGHARPRSAGSSGGGSVGGSGGGSGWGVPLTLTTAPPAAAGAPTTGRCWPLFERGPCARGQVLLPGGGCGADPCARENAPRGGQRRQQRQQQQRGRFVPLDGGCHQLGASCPRENAPEGAKVGFNPATGNPACVDSANDVVLNLVKAPDNCNTAVGGGSCEKVVAVPDGKDYVNILLEAAERKRRKRRARGGGSSK